MLASDRALTRGKVEESEPPIGLAFRVNPGGRVVPAIHTPSDPRRNSGVEDVRLANLAETRPLSGNFATGRCEEASLINDVRTVPAGKTRVV